MRAATDSIDAALDVALELTFPASDPIALCMPDYDGRAVVANQSSPEFPAVGMLAADAGLALQASWSRSCPVVLEREVSGCGTPVGAEAPFRQLPAQFA